MLPDAVRETVLRREWNNLRQLKDRLLARRTFPIVVPLKAPRGNAAVNDISHFQAFIEAWKQFHEQNWVRWEERHYRSLLTQSVPTAFELHSFSELVAFIGEPAETRQAHWREVMQPLLDIDKSLYPVCVEHLTTMDTMDNWQSRALANVLLQLHSGMGQGLYLRALPLKGIHTKFLETFDTIIASLLDVIYRGELSDAGGLKNWLDCLDAPRNWLYVRPLCNKSKAAMGGFNCLQLSLDELATRPLPASRILIVENLQSGYALPELLDTVAVFGGGHNTAWITAAKWLLEKEVAYWGDIDTWGFKILSDVREKIPNVTALMMNVDTFMRFQQFVSQEPTPCKHKMPALTQDEHELVEKLSKAYPTVRRLEQEFLPSDYIVSQLNHWAMAE